MTVFVHPDMHADELRQTLYGENLVILTSLRAVGALVEYVHARL